MVYNIEYIIMTSKLNQFFESLKKNKIPTNVADKELAEYVDSDLNGYTPMHIVAENKWSDGVDWLISNNFPIDVQDHTGKFPFEYYPDLRLLNTNITVTKQIWRAALRGNLIIKNTFKAKLEDFILLTDVAHWNFISHDNMDTNVLKFYLDKGGDDLNFINHFKWNTYINKKSVWNYVGGNFKWIGTKWRLGQYMMDMV